MLQGLLEISDDAVGKQLGRLARLFHYERVYLEGRLMFLRSVIGEPPTPCESQHSTLVRAIATGMHCSRRVAAAGQPGIPSALLHRCPVAGEGAAKYARRNISLLTNPEEDMLDNLKSYEEAHGKQEAMARLLSAPADVLLPGATQLKRWEAAQSNKFAMIVMLERHRPIDPDEQQGTSHLRN